MRYGVTFNQDGQPLPPGLHIPQNFAHLPYVPHPLQIMGGMATFPVLGQATATAGQGASVSRLAAANSGTRGRPL